MLETKLILTPFTTLDEVRKFVELTTGSDGGQQVLRYDPMHDEIDGIAASYGEAAK